MRLVQRGTAGFDLIADDGVKFGQIDISDDTMYIYPLEKSITLVSHKDSAGEFEKDDKVLGYAIERKDYNA
jgi:hypothetical protein